jgi:hypothetical protein
MDAPMNEPTVYLVTSHAANNDINGNPRRVYVFQAVTLYDDDDTDRRGYYGTDGFAHIVFTHDEGYGGLRPAMEAFRSSIGTEARVVDLGRVDASVTEYKRLVKWTPAD